MKIDAHQHFWRHDPAIHTWMDEKMQLLRQDFLPAQLLPLLQAEGINGCVAVQADSSRRENDFLLGLAADHPWILGVVGWVDLQSDQLESQLDQFCQHYHQERNHQGLDNKIIEPDFGSDREGEVNCRDRLGGWLRYYHREAA